MTRFAIVVIGYNRPESMKRILHRLSECYYDDENVTLITSIDNCGDDRVEKVCDLFEWKYGEKRVIKHAQRMGLRKHILSCGDLLLNDEFDALAVFEDDIYPSESFYLYMKATYEKYVDNEQIAGISLYSPTYATSNDFKFSPQESMYDVYFMKVAQSWGQIWTAKQWRKFKDWYESNSEEWEYSDFVPAAIGKWGQNSWLKYYMKYCGEKDLYFVYPYKSLTTCYSETGQHTIESSTVLQRPLVVGRCDIFRLPDLDEKAIRYDAFYENENVLNNISDAFQIQRSEITIDIYGTKPTHKRYWLTIKSDKYKVLKSFDMNMKPHEMNVIHAVPGSRIFLYDTCEQGVAPEYGLSYVNALEYYNDFKFNRKKILKLFIPVMMRSFNHYMYAKKHGYKK